MSMVVKKPVAKSKTVKELKGLEKKIGKVNASLTPASLSRKNDPALWDEIVRMTDHRTFDLFVPIGEAVSVVAAPISRLVLDVERFEKDEQEPMSACGMGVIYNRTADGEPLRRTLQPAERENLLSTYYRPHHQRLQKAANAAMQAQGHCLIIDGHRK